MPIDLKLSLIAVFFQVALTFYAAISTALARLRAIKEHDIRLADVALNSRAYPDAALKHGNNLSNQFEFPVLLYVAVVLALVLEASSMPFALACLGYVVTRLHHRIVHVTANDVRHRFVVFLVGIILLALAWAFLLLGIFNVL